MALFLSQIEKPIKKELYRRINLSSHGYERTATPGNILDPVKIFLIYLTLEVLLL